MQATLRDGKRYVAEWDITPEGQHTLTYIDDAFKEWLAQHDMTTAANVADAARVRLLWEKFQRETSDARPTELGR
jgi:hypothetical protein